MTQRVRSGEGVETVQVKNRRRDVMASTLKVPFGT